MAGLRPGFGRGGMIHSLDVRLKVPPGVVGGGDAAGGVGAGFMMREGRWTMLGLTSAVAAGEAAAGVGPALLAMARLLPAVILSYGRDRAVIAEGESASRAVGGWL